MENGNSERWAYRSEWNVWRRDVSTIVFETAWEIKILHELRLIVQASTRMYDWNEKIAKLTRRKFINCRTFYFRLGRKKDL